MKAIFGRCFMVALSIGVFWNSPTTLGDNPSWDGRMGTVYATATDPFELDFDTDGTLYAGHHSPSNGPAFLYQIPPGGGMAVEWGSEAPEDPDGIDVFAGHVYASSEGNIWQAEIPGGAMSVMATVAGSPNQSTLVVDEQGDYFDAGTVIVGNARFATDIHVINPTTTVVSSFVGDSPLTVIRALQFVDGTLYCLEAESAKGVWAIDVTGVPTKVPDDDFAWGNLNGLAYDPGTDSFLVGSATELLRLPRTGGTPEVVGSGFGSISGLTFDDDGSLYVADYGEQVIWTFDDSVIPVGFEVTRGTYVAGGIAELAASDNLDLTARRNLADTQSRVFLELTSVSPTDSPSSFQFTLEAAVFARTPVEQSIDLWNYVTSDWELVNVNTASRFVDSVTVAMPTGDLSRFVESGTQNIKARCRFQSINPRQQFSANVDQTIWTIE